MPTAVRTDSWPPLRRSARKSNGVPAAGEVLEHQIRLVGANVVNCMRRSEFSSRPYVSLGSYGLTQMPYRLIQYLFFLPLFGSDLFSKREYFLLNILTPAGYFVWIGDLGNRDAFY